MSSIKLNKVQQSAVEAIHGPVLIFAGAGSGKTRVLTHKISYLIETGAYKPENILAVTFTNKAAKEMKTRVQKLLKMKKLELDISTFHSICARLLRSEIHRLGYSNTFAIYDVEDQIALMKIVLNNLNISKETLMPNSARSQISYFKNKMLIPDNVQKKARTKQEQMVGEVFQAYQAALKENNAVDFDDLLILPLEIFKQYPDILKKYQKKWKYILVDEYQDTNRPQFLFVSQLAEVHHQICVVGDDDQSIYSWRGADIKNILGFKKKFPGCSIFTLEKNYRSTQQILSAATAVVEKNLDRKPKTMKSVNGSGDKIALFETVDEMEEADAIVSALEKEINLNKRTFRDFAVLYRTNAQSRALEDSFRRQGIPYTIVGGIRFYERAEVKNLLAYLKFIVNMKDTVSLRRIINFPPRGIGLKTVDKCVTYAEKVKKELFDILPEGIEVGVRGKQCESLTKFHGIIQKYNDLLKKVNAGELARSLVDETKILKYYKNLNTPEDNERYNNILELLNSIDAFLERNPKGGIREFIEEVSLLTDIDNWNDETNCVTLMTLHSAKGLEFPVIFITGLEDGLLPFYKAFNDRKEMEEERRLFYVGLTRAIEKVYLLYARHRRKMGLDYTMGLASRFLKEIPVEYLENISFNSALMRRVTTSKRGKRTKVKVTRSITLFDDFMVGDYVKHAIFGLGKIMALSGSGENQRVGVVFKDGLKKKLIVKYANLKKVDTPAVN